MPSRNNIVAKYNFDYETPDVETRRPSDARPPSDERRRRVSDYLPSSRGGENFFTTFLKFSFFAVMFALFSFVFLIVLQTLGFKTFSFLPDDGGVFSVPLLPTNRQNAFSNRLMAADASANLVNVVSSNHTVSLDVYINNDFINQSVPRVLLYRTLIPVVLSANDTSIAGIILRMPQTNFVLYLDPYTNDLMATVVCQSSNAPSGIPLGIPSGVPRARASAAQNAADAAIMTQVGIKTISIAPIENVPIRKPFRITMMLSDVLLEVYINGELQKSVPFNGNVLRVVPAKSHFYGPPAIVGQSVLVSNISYWNTSLSSKAIRLYGKESLNASVFSKV
jgi:hypothetical protein